MGEAENHMYQEYMIREACLNDLDVIVSFTIEEAREAEAAELDAEGVRRGVLAGLEDPAVASYWVAERQNGQVVGSTSVVREWSNFRGAHYWWIQSLFIAPEHRGRGLVELLLEHLSEAAADGGALDLRLYAHASNERALKVYERCGFSRAPYAIMRRRLRGG